MISITKYVEFDAGHRVPDHLSKCRSPHGHRYKVEAEVTGPVLTAGPENGMVLDFGHLKALLTDIAHDRFDHAFILYAGDTELYDFLTHTDFKVAVLSKVPTAENLAAVIAEDLEREVTNWHPDLTLTRVTVWETPTCTATWTPA